MMNTKSGKQNAQGMTALVLAIFPSLAVIPAATMRTAAGKASNPAKPRAMPLPRSKRQQARYQALQSVFLASALGLVLAAYNLGDTLLVQAAKVVIRVIA